MADEDFERPALPVELTKKNWDKKRGKIAKMAGKNRHGGRIFEGGEGV